MTEEQLKALLTYIDIKCEGLARMSDPFSSFGAALEGSHRARRIAEVRDYLWETVTTQNHRTADSGEKD